MLCKKLSNLEKAAGVEMKPQTCWAIFSGKVMITSSIRDTKQSCKQHYLAGTSHESFLRGFKDGWLSCRKVVVTELIGK